MEARAVAKLNRRNMYTTENSYQFALKKARQTIVTEDKNAGRLPVDATVANEEIVPVITLQQQIFDSKKELVAASAKREEMKLFVTTTLASIQQQIYSILQQIEVLVSEKSQISAQVAQITLNVTELQTHTTSLDSSVASMVTGQAATDAAVSQMATQVAALDARQILTENACVSLQSQIDLLQPP